MVVEPRRALAAVGAVAFALATAACAPTRAPEAPHAEDACASRSAAASDPSALRAVEIVKGLYGAKRDEVYASFGDGFRRAISLEKVQRLVEQIETENGKWLAASYADEDPVDTPGWRSIRVVSFYEHGAAVYTITLDDKRVLRGLLVVPLAPRDTRGPGPADDYVAKHAYALPASGAWYVDNGGRAAAGNGHVGNTQQWYGLDLVQHGSNGKSFTGEGTRNEDYLAFGQPVRAPADGTVVAVVDGVPDNVPGEMNGYIAPGNYVAIDHGDGETSFLAHIERGSFEVKPGAVVKAGDVLGRVGNSGNSSEPHIHWHLATDPRLEKGHGLPIRFVPLLVNGNSVASPAPTKADQIEAPP